MDGNVLRQVLANNADPPPPHLYAEMARWTYMDGKTQEKFYGAVFAALHGETSFSLRTLADTFAGGGSSSNHRMTSSAVKDKVHVLYKALHLIKVLCETGSADFQKAAQRHEHTERMRLLCHFHAAPDPLYGDAFNAKVRHEAEAALQATLAPRADAQLPFATSSTSSNAVSYLQQRTTGFGSGVVAQPRPQQHEGGNGELGGGGEAERASAVRWRSRVAEMPTRNAWAEHMVAAQHGGGVSSGESGAVAGKPHGTQSSKTGNLFEHLAQSAKDAMRLLREHEALRTQADEVSLTRAQRKQRAQQLAAAGAAVGSSRGAFVPLDTRAIALPAGTRTSSAAPGDEARPAETTAFAFLRADTGNAATSSSSSSQQQHHHDASPSPKNDSAGSHAAESHASSSAFAFLASLSPPGQQQQEGQRESLAEHDKAVHHRQESSTCVPCPFQGLLDKYTRRSASATALSRGELASFVQECVDAVRSASEKGNGSNDTRALCEAVQERLALQRPWQERLHTLCCLAALLQHVPPVLDIEDNEAKANTCSDHNDDRQHTAEAQTAEVLYDAFADTTQRTTEKCNNNSCDAQAVALGVFRYFRQHAEPVRRNTAVVQASLRERACAVLHSLRLETEREMKEDAVPAPAVSAPTAEAGRAAGGLSWAGMKVRQGGTELRRKPASHTTQQVQTRAAHTLQGFFDPTATTTLQTTLQYPASLHATKQPITEEELFGTTTQVMAPPPQEAMQWPPASTQDATEGVQGMQLGDGYEAMSTYDMPPPPPTAAATTTATLLHLQSSQATSNNMQLRGRRVFAEVQAEMRAKMADASDT